MNAPFTYVKPPPLLVLIGLFLALSTYRQHYPGVGDSDVGVREAGGRPRGTGLRPHRPRREAGEEYS